MTAALALGVVTVAEASIGIFVKLAGDQVPVLALNFYRVFFAAIFLLIVMSLFSKASLRFPEKNVRDIAIIGALIALQISLFNYAMTLTTVANAVVFWSVAPFFVFIFSSIFLGEKPRPVYGIVFLLAFVGIVIAEPITFSFASWSTVQLGNAVALSTGVVYAALVTYLRSEGKTETKVDMLWFMVAASVYLAPTLLFVGVGDVFAVSSATLFGANVPVILWLVGLGMFSTGLAYYCIGYVLKNMNANIYSLIDIIVSPLIAACFAFLVFTEVPSVSLVKGGAILLLSGALLTVLRTRKKKKLFSKRKMLPVSR